MKITIRKIKLLIKEEEKRNWRSTLEFNPEDDDEIASHLEEPNIDLADIRGPIQPDEKNSVFVTSDPYVNDSNPTTAGSFRFSKIR